MLSLLRTFDNFDILECRHLSNSVIRKSDNLMVEVKLYSRSQSPISFYLSTVLCKKSSLLAVDTWLPYESRKRRTNHCRSDMKLFFFWIWCSGCQCLLFFLYCYIFSMHVSMEYGGITLYFCMYPNGLLLLINNKK